MWDILIGSIKTDLFLYRKTLHNVFVFGTHYNLSTQRDQLDN